MFNPIRFLGPIKTRTELLGLFLALLLHAAFPAKTEATIVLTIADSGKTNYDFTAGNTQSVTYSGSLAGIVLSGDTLSTVLHPANLAGSTLTGGNLSGAILSNASLFGSFLNLVDFTGGVLSNAII